MIKRMNFKYLGKSKNVNVFKHMDLTRESKHHTFLLSVQLQV